MLRVFGTKCVYPPVGVLSQCVRPVSAQLTVPGTRAMMFFLLLQ